MKDKKICGRMMALSLLNFLAGAYADEHVLATVSTEADGDGNWSLSGTWDGEGYTMRVNINGSAEGWTNDGPQMRVKKTADAANLSAVIRKLIWGYTELLKAWYDGSPTAQQFLGQSVSPSHGPPVGKT